MLELFGETTVEAQFVQEIFVPTTKGSPDIKFQVKSAPPDAVNVTSSPSQSVWSAPAEVFSTKVTCLV